MTVSSSYWARMWRPSFGHTFTCSVYGSLTNATIAPPPPNNKLTCPAGAGSYELQKAYLPAGSGAAPGSSLCGVPPRLRAGNLGQALAILSSGPAAVPVLSVVLRASPLRPLVRLGRGAF